MRSEEEVTRAIETYSDTVQRLCLIHLKNQADTEDIFQTVFLKYALCSTVFESPEHEKAWLIVCAQNHCRDMLRSAARRCAAELPDDVPDDRTGADGDETLEAVLALPPKYKTCVYLYYYEGYRTADIALITGTPASTVRSHLSEARALLKTMLGGERRERP